MSEDLEDRLFEAIARGYCHKENSNKPPDVELCKAIRYEVMKEMTHCPNCLKLNREIVELEKVEEELHVLLKEKCDNLRTVRKEICDDVNSLQVVEPTTTFGKFGNEQVFIAGQINVLMRLNDLVQKIREGKP